MDWNRLVLAVLLVGCAGGKDRDDEVASIDTDVESFDPDAPTWSEDVAPLINENCNFCHRAEGIGDRLQWLTYEETHPYKDAIAAAVTDLTMPPFIAGEDDQCAPRFPFVNDLRLTAAEITTLVEWAEGGGPPGPGTVVLDPPAPPSLAEYDMELTAENPYNVEKGDEFVCWAMPVEGIPAGTEAWLNAMEILPSDPTVAHHVQIKVFEDDSVLDAAGPEGWWECGTDRNSDGIDFGGWLPGTAPVEMPEGVAVRITSTSHVMVQVHYHSVHDDVREGKPSVRLRFGNKPREQPQVFRVGNYREAKEFGGLIGNEFDLDPSNPKFYVPPYAENHVELMEYQMPLDGDDFYVFMVTNHMHLAGVSSRMYVIHERARGDEPKVECLLNTPNYDFDWQNFFYFDLASGNAPEVRAGDVVRVECVFDNSENNLPFMEELENEGLIGSWPFAVELGAETTDEMCTGMLGVVPQRF